MDEMVALYPGEWVLMKVTAFEHGWPSHGEVVAHDTSRAAITGAWTEVVRAKKPDDRYYVFRACHYIRTGASLREALEVLQETWDGEVGRGWPRW